MTYKIIKTEAAYRKAAKRAMAIFQAKEGTSEGDEYATHLPHPGGDADRGQRPAHHPARGFEHQHQRHDADDHVGLILTGDLQRQGARQFAKQRPVDFEDPLGGIHFVPSWGHHALRREVRSPGTTITRASYPPRTVSASAGRTVAPLGGKQ